MSIAKKIFIISSVLLASVLFFLGIYNISFKPKNTALNNSSAQTTNSKKENSGIVSNIEEKLGIKNKEKIYALSQGAAISPFVSEKEEKIKYYNPSNGSVSEVSFNGEGRSVIDENNFEGLEKVSWSPDGSKVISRFNSGGKIQYTSYDYSTKIFFKLANGIEFAAWNNLGDQIVYKYSDSKTGKKTINTANFDGSNWKKIADISISNFWMSMVPQSSFVSFWNSPNALEETLLYLVSTVAGDSKKIFSGRFGADYLWSPNGTKALISSTDSRGGSKIGLGVINSNGGEFQNLNIPTFTSKCAWGKDNKTVYYALPSFPSENNMLPNDYQNGKISSKDTFWKVDITTGKAERLVETSDIKNLYDAKNLFLSPSEDILFFINRTDGKLYGINLQ
ncbi:MAG: hypothetical protein V1804_04410 [Patescibacteria group bacterium]